MAYFRAAICAALFFFAAAKAVLAQDVTLISPDGSIALSGNLLGYDGEFYRVDTQFGELTVDGSGVRCEGPGCPNLSDFVAEVRFAGSATMAEVLLPALVEGFALRNGYLTERGDLGPRQFEYRLARVPGRTVARFVFEISNTDEGFADLLTNAADVTMALREIRPTERDMALEAGLGDLTGANRSRVLALDAMVPVVSPTNPVQRISLPELAAIFTGDITNWQQLGGPDAPISAHLLVAGSGLTQAVEDKLIKPTGKDITAEVRRHDRGSRLVGAVATDPFAIGIASYAETGSARPVTLTGSCGFASAVSRRAIKTEDYPLTSPMFLYLPARRLPRVAREFMSYIQGPAAQIVIRRADFVDQAPEMIPVAAQGERLANAITVAGEASPLSELQRLVGLVSGMERLTTSFRFEAGSSRLDAQSRSNLELLARELETGFYDAKRLVFVGFSDGEGPSEPNRRIAQERAQTVRDAVVKLAETANFDRVQMEVTGFGEAMPMACDDSAWGRQVNRRVEIWVQ